MNDHKPVGRPGVKRKTAQTGTWKQLTYHDGTVCSNASGAPGPCKGLCSWFLDDASKDRLGGRQEAVADDLEDVTAQCAPTSDGPAADS